MISNAANPSRYAYSGGQPGKLSSEGSHSVEEVNFAWRIIIY